MSKDTSLSEFATTDPDEEDGDASESVGAGEDGGEPSESVGADGEVSATSESVAEAEKDAKSAAPDDEAAVEPAGATYGWTPDGAACERCGESVERRWSDDDGMVCSDCKEW
ncbi:DUF7573 domain-containing protein [Haladaptatus salinisoli]|uniref:DUF7573 domain-containing protein n=1 Tax=Haladaptatus salinisoli TaxID=2884876 RepID=UPI001D0ADC2E|nr:hypothetical protein [Haladaptatus salinisoli]